MWCVLLQAVYQQKRAGVLSGGETRSEPGSTLCVEFNASDEPNNDLGYRNLVARKRSPSPDALGVTSHDRWSFDRIANIILAGGRKSRALALFEGNFNVPG